MTNPQRRQLKLQFSTHQRLLKDGLFCLLEPRRVHERCFNTCRVHRLRSLCSAFRAASATPCTRPNKAWRTRSVSAVKSSRVWKHSVPLLAQLLVWPPSGGRGPWVAGAAVCCGLSLGLLREQLCSPRSGVLPHLGPRRSAAAVQHHAPGPAR